MVHDKNYTKRGECITLLLHKKEVKKKINEKGGPDNAHKGAMPYKQKKDNIIICQEVQKS